MEYPSIGTPPSGSIRFNTDSSKMEIYNGEKWWEIDSTTPEVQTGGTRFVIGGGGAAPNNKNTIEYFNIQTTSNAVDFGDLLGAGYHGATFADRTRGIWAGSYTGAGRGNVISYVTVASTGNAQDFGDVQANGKKVEGNGMANRTRGISLPAQNSNGAPYYTNSLDYITIQAKGNDVEFGDATSAQGLPIPGWGNQTRGIFVNGASPSNRSVEYIHFSTKGNSAAFGDLRDNNFTSWAASNAVRGIVGSNHGGGGKLDYFTNATLGNYTTFGTLTQARSSGASGASSLRAVFAGGNAASPDAVNTTDYVQIATTGNAVDFGDLPYAAGLGAVQQCKGFTNGHGGLG